MQSDRISGLSVLSIIENTEAQKIDVGKIIDDLFFASRNYARRRFWRKQRLSCVHQIQTNTKRVLHFVLAYTLCW